MSSLAPPSGTKKGIPNTGATRGGVAGGVSKRTGQMNYGTTKRRTAGMTTTGTRGPEDHEWEMYMGQKIYVKPKPLMIKHSDKAAAEDQGRSMDALADDGSRQDGASKNGDEKLDKGSKKEEKKAGKETDDTKKKESNSEHS